MWQNTLAQFINIDGSNKEYCWRTKIKLVAQKIGNNHIKIIRHPASYEAVLVISKKYTCPNKECNYIVQNLNDDAFPHSPVTPSVVADVLNTKYSLGVPLDRYSKYLISQGINISTQNLSNYVIRAAHKLEPLYNSIKNELVNR